MNRYGYNPRRRSRYFLEHGTPEWDAMWDRVKTWLSDAGYDVTSHFDGMLYQGTWEGEHHFTSDEGRIPGRKTIDFTLPINVDGDEQDDSAEQSAGFQAAS